MKKEELFDTLGDINVQYIQEAHMKNKRKNNFAWAKWGTIAACCAIVLVTCVSTVNYLSSTVEDNTPDTETSGDATGNPIADLQAEKVENDNKEEASVGKPDSAPNTQTDSTSNTDIEDVPADKDGSYMEAVNSSDLTKDTSDFFGGSYTDASGKFVIVLTEDTPANRTAICKELGRNESKTTFVSGTYTLAYLTELQAKISNAMVNKELPFVVSSALSETTNNIVVGVTTTDESELAKVYALDAIGGAIKVEFSSGATTDLLAVPKAE